MVRERQEQQLIGESPAFLEVLEHASRVAPLDRPVLVIGERGMAKGELEYSHRRDSESRDLKREEVLDLLKG